MLVTSENLVNNNTKLQLRDALLHSKDFSIGFLSVLLRESSNKKIVVFSYKHRRITSVALKARPFSKSVLYC